MLCLIQTSDYQFELPATQPTDYTTCTYILAQPQDVHADAWNLTMDDAITLMPYFALVLVMGFTFRAVARALNTGDTTNESST